MEIFTNLAVTGLLALFMVVVLVNLNKKLRHFDDAPIADNVSVSQNVDRSAVRRCDICVMNDYFAGCVHN